MSCLNNIPSLNKLKEAYSEKQQYLKDLKIKVTNGQDLDQMVRSKFRIQIEGLIIDINEELFAISEEISKVFLNNSQLSAQNQNHKIQEFENKKQSIFQRI